MNGTRRGMFKSTLAALVLARWSRFPAAAAADELKGPDNVPEDNLRLYSYDRARRQLASASVKAPALGQWHTVRLVAIGDHMQAWLDGKLYLDHRDSRFRSGRVGLWTKADSITAFDDLTIRGVTGGA